MTEPENLDAWVPLKAPPKNLFIISVERTMDAALLKALKRAEAELGAVRRAGTSPDVRIDFEQPLADVYAQMTAADIAAFALTYPAGMTRRFSSCAAAPPCMPSTLRCAR